MLDLSPTKLLIILIVAVAVVGPRRLPRVAHELAKGWRRLRELHAEIDREVRESVPGLSSGLDLIRHTRSPVALLNQLAEAVPVQADDGCREKEAAPAAVGDAPSAESRNIGPLDPIASLDPPPPEARPSLRRPIDDAGTGASTLGVEVSAVRGRDDPSTN